MRAIPFLVALLLASCGGAATSASPASPPGPGVAPNVTFIIPSATPVPIAATPDIDATVKAAVAATVSAMQVSNNPIQPSLTLAATKAPAPSATATSRPAVVPPTAQATVAVLPTQASPVQSYPDGNYLVGTDLPAGTYRTVGTGTSCYWARMDKNQGTIDNDLGATGGLITLVATDFELQVKRCGGFTPLSQIQRLGQDAQRAARPDGKYLPGYDIAPGVWRSDGSVGGDSCYWARQDIRQNTLDNYLGNSRAVITIRSTDAQVEFKRCGVWTRIQD